MGDDFAPKAAAEAPGPEKWRRWLNGLRNEVLGLRLYRTFWRGLIQAAESNPNVPRTPVFGYLASTYSASQALAVRRLCGEQRREVSFKNLLREIAENPELIPEKQVNVADVRLDLKALDAGSLWRINKYVSQTLAHAQETPTGPAPTFADLYQAIDELSGLLRKYMLLVLDEDQILDAVGLGD